MTRYVQKQVIKLDKQTDDMITIQTFCPGLKSHVQEFNTKEQTSHVKKFNIEHDLGVRIYWEDVYAKGA